MKEIRLHGRGGQGVAMAAEILAGAFIAEGKQAAAFPMFGAERRGAPVTAFVRFDDGLILEKTQVYSPDCLIVTDPVMGTSPAVFVGLRPGGVLVVNGPAPISAMPHENLCVIGAVDATRIALKEIGIPATNTCLLGAFARTTGWLRMESLFQRLKDYFQGEGLEKNMKAIARGFAEVKLMEVVGGETSAERRKVGNQ